ncbi:MAG: alginate export family protein, partial [Chthonomonadetes bacterium]|nr:alginate export family protein [Chthonomonadetes bacterium]
MRFLAATLVGWCVIGLQLVSSAGQTSPTGSPLNISTEWRVRYEDRNCTSFCSMNQKDVQDELSRLRVNLSTHFGQNSQVFARFQYSYRRNHQSGSADTQEKSGFQQLYLDTKWDNLSLRLGRQELGYGDYRLLILSNWDNIGYTWDAVRLGIKGSSWQADVLYGRPGMFPTSTTHPVLYGIYANVKPNPRWQSDLYLLRKEVIDSGSQHRIWAMGAQPSVRLSQNTSLTAEMALQSGKVGSKSLKAWGYWLRLEQDIPRLRNTKMILQYDFASGGNPDDSTLHTFDQFFGTTFAICGRMGLQGWRNMNSWRVCVPLMVGECNQKESNSQNTQQPQTSTHHRKSLPPLNTTHRQ